jgi:hypothetical protein
MHRDTDLFADAGQRLAFTQAYGGSSQKAALINAIGQACIDGMGWTLSSSGSSGGFPFYEVISQQSPWWDESVTPPANYVGKIRFRIVSDQASNVRFIFKNADATFVQTVSQTRIAERPSEPMHQLIICPYQIVLVNPLRTDNQLIGSALHTARLQQVDKGYEECLWHSKNFGRTRLDSTTNTHCVSMVKHRDGTHLWDTEDLRGPNGTRALVLRPGSDLYSRVRFANIVDDPTLVTEASWFPMHAPPAFGWGDQLSAAQRNNAVPGNVKLRAWPWDCIEINEAYALGTYTFATPGGGVWMAYTAGTATPSLFFRVA